MRCYLAQGSVNTAKTTEITGQDDAPQDFCAMLSDSDFGGCTAGYVLLEVCFNERLRTAELAALLCGLVGRERVYARPVLLKYCDAANGWLLLSAQSLVLESITPGVRIKLADFVDDFIADQVTVECALLEHSFAGIETALLMPVVAGMSITLGRAGECEITLKNISVSRRHLEICFAEVNTVFTDLSSRNGTLVQGELLSGAVTFTAAEPVRFVCGRVAGVLTRNIGVAAGAGAAGAIDSASFSAPVDSGAFVSLTTPEELADAGYACEADSFKLSQNGITALAAITAGMRAAAEAESAAVTDCESELEFDPLPQPNDKKQRLNTAALVAPLVISAVMYWVTRMPYVVLLALASPLMLLFSWLDSRVSDHKNKRQEYQNHWHETSQKLATLVRGAQQKRFAHSALIAQHRAELARLGAAEFIEWAQRFWLRSGLYLGLTAHPSCDVSAIVRALAPARHTSLRRVLEPHLQTPHQLFSEFSGGVGGAGVMGVAGSTGCMGVAKDEGFASAAGESARLVHIVGAPKVCWAVARGIIAQFIICFAARERGATVSVSAPQTAFTEWGALLSMPCCNILSHSGQHSEIIFAIVKNAADSGADLRSRLTLRIVDSERDQAPQLRGETLLLDDFAESADAVVGSACLSGFTHEHVTFSALNNADYKRLCALVTRRLSIGSGVTATANTWLESVFGVTSGNFRDTVIYNWMARPTQPLVFDAHTKYDLVADGPHMLLAGTTGAGKSELLQSLLLGLACACNPESLRLLLIDYKGSASFGKIAKLPHCEGLITDLDEGSVARLFRVIKAEMVLREKRFREAQVSDYAEYLKLGRTDIARLLIVFDEFAAMLRDHPASSDTVADISQRARSLGIHLIIATQQPAGVISSKVRANTQIRVSLRVMSHQDSQDVIGSPAAAALSRAMPGAGFVKVAAEMPRRFNAPAVNVPADKCVSKARFVTPETDVGGGWFVPPQKGDTVAQQLVRDLRVLASQQAYIPAVIWLEELKGRLDCAVVNGLEGLRARGSELGNTAGSTRNTARNVGNSAVKVENTAEKAEDSAGNTGNTAADTAKTRQTAADCFSTALAVQDLIVARQRRIIDCRDLPCRVLAVATRAESKTYFLTRTINSLLNANKQVVYFGVECPRELKETPNLLQINVTERYRTIRLLQNLGEILARFGEATIVCEVSEQFLQYFHGADTAFIEAWLSVMNQVSGVSVVFIGSKGGILPPSIADFSFAKVFLDPGAEYELQAAGASKEQLSEMERYTGRIFFAADRTLAQVMRCRGECCRIKTREDSAYQTFLRDRHLLTDTNILGAGSCAVSSPYRGRFYDLCTGREIRVLDSARFVSVLSLTTGIAAQQALSLAFTEGLRTAQQIVAITDLQVPQELAQKTVESCYISVLRPRELTESSLTKFFSELQGVTASHSNELTGSIALPSGELPGVAGRLSNVVIVVADLPELLKTVPDAIRIMQRYQNENGLCQLVLGYCETSDFDWDTKRMLDSADTVLQFGACQTSALHKRLQLVDFRHAKLAENQACLYRQSGGSPEISYVQYTAEANSDRLTESGRL
ncbi:FHA domain-containing protein [Canibacter sp. lx-45]|uniref:FtsK/SpoIIIE domain-containing protein n=1 Tax=Canibacter zhuwentaonis TaxID=2837491 RepID=UPI001BDC608A|nr:FHA domain-containing protein [Canibacter zhuwentaonis]